jgi:hypothetical protein
MVTASIIYGCGCFKHLLCGNHYTCRWYSGLLDALSCIILDSANLRTCKHDLY